MSTMDWFLMALQGLLVIFFIFLGVRSGGIGLGLWGGVGTLILVFVFGLEPGRAAHQRNAHHHRGHLGGGGDAGRRRHRLHGPDREQGAPSATEVAQLRRAVRLVRPHDPHRHGEHVLLDHPGDQRGRVREQDPARARARRLDGRIRARDHVQPGGGGDGNDSAARRGVRLRPHRRPAHHDPREHHRHPPDGIPHEPPRERPRRRRRVPAASRGGRGQPSRTAGRDRPVAVRQAQRGHLPRRGRCDLRLRPLRGAPPDRRRRGRRRRADVDHAAHPDVHAQRSGADPLALPRRRRTTSRARRSSAPGWWR